MFAILGDIMIKEKNKKQQLQKYIGNITRKFS